MWALAAILLGIFSVLRQYARDADMPYLDLSVLPFWDKVASASWYIGFACFVIAMLLIVSLIVWHCIGIRRWICRKRKGEAKPMSETEKLTESITLLTLEFKEIGEKLSLLNKPKSKDERERK